MTETATTVRKATAFALLQKFREDFAGEVMDGLRLSASAFWDTDDDAGQMTQEILEEFIEGDYLQAAFEHARVIGMMWAVTVLKPDATFEDIQQLLREIQHLRDKS